mmetsp:Transcript_129220/g.258020  ORF Transcript_129220/g.258020 Transcript_129220/m.258020 type:complete len:223 (+) Transcript_129220:487-1155(+)
MAIDSAVAGKGSIGVPAVCDAACAVWPLRLRENILEMLVSAVFVAFFNAPGCLSTYCSTPSTSNAASFLPPAANIASFSMSFSMGLSSRSLGWPMQPRRWGTRRHRSSICMPFVHAIHCAVVALQHPPRPSICLKNGLSSVPKGGGRFRISKTGAGGFTKPFTCFGFKNWTGGIRSCQAWTRVGHVHRHTAVDTKKRAIMRAHNGLQSWTANTHPTPSVHDA